MSRTVEHSRHATPPPPARHETTGRAGYAADEIVVARDSAGLVAARLRAWGAAPTCTDAPRLGLARLDLSAGAAARLARAALAELADHDDPAVRCTEAELMGVGEPTSSSHHSALDVVLRALRRVLRHEHHGWVPGMGKNRHLSDPLGPAQQIGFGGADTPRLVAVPRGHRPGTDGAGVRVGLIDTRLIDHPWLAGGVLADPAQVLPASPRPDGAAAHHGTFVAGLILRQAPRACIVATAGLDVSGHSDSWDVACLLADLADDDVPLVNLSLSCCTDDDEPPLVLSAAVAALGRRVLVVAAAGNHADTPGSTSHSARPAWPAALDGVVAVGSARGGQVSPYSPDGPWVDAYAPGDDVVSSFGVSGGEAQFARGCGTSFAAAAVAGAIAARLRPHGDARSAFESLSCPTLPGRDRPFVPLRPVPGWPADGAS